jgi:hypothetical protein
MAGYKLVFKGLKKFNADLEKFANETMPDAHLRIQKKIAFDLFDAIITKAPVGNPSIWDGRAVGKKYPPRKPPSGYVGGRSRGNWQISVSAPGNKTVETFETGAQTGTPPGPQLETAAFAGMAKAKFGQTIWIYNNVRYIKRLEDGWSTQAPAGMVAISIAEFEAGLIG